MGGRVLRIITRLNRGGPLRQLCGLVPALERLGWTGPVLAGRTESHEPDGSADLLEAGAVVIPVRAMARGLDPAADLRALRTILGHLRRVRPHVVHTHMGKAGALGRLAAAIGRVPAVHTFHGHHLQAPWPRDRLACAAERTLAPLTTAAICLTARQRRDLCEIHRPLDRAKVEVIGPGLDVEALRRRVTPENVAAIRDRLVPDGRPLLLWAGRFVPPKDPLLLVRAVANSRRTFRLAMLGDGPLRAEALELIREEGVGDVVHCPGPVADTAPWVAASDLVVLSSRSEGAPLLVVEAKVLGRAALVTAVGGVPDLVRHGVDGWWVPPDACRDFARALDDLTGDPALLGRLGKAAERDATERFSAARLARETAALYERIRVDSKGWSRSGRA